MKRAAVIGLSIGLFAGISAIAWGYEVETHEEMSQKAMEASVLAKDPKLLTDLGLKPLSDKQKFPNSKNSDQDIANLFRDGAKFEDGFDCTDTRPRNHFYDPLSGSGLKWGLITGAPSPDWALEDKGDVNGQEFSYKNARQYLYDALTAKSPAEHDKNFGLTFQTLGQIIHHLQDMAQPQHVRNDPHYVAPPDCGAVTYLGKLLGDNHSRYELYTNEHRGKLDYNGKAVSFLNPRSFWTTGSGQGLAEYTNRNFVSAGTNYQLFNDSPVPHVNYFEPIPSGFGPLVTIEELFNERGETTTLTGVMGFVENEVYDPRTGIQTTNKRSASLSIYDQDLKTHGVAVPYADPVSGETWWTNRLFTLNRFNFDAAHGFLIPRAVAYSAGLIDYFFRGRPEAEENSTEPRSLT